MTPNTLIININDASIEIPVGPNTPAITLVDENGHSIMTFSNIGFMVCKDFKSETVGFTKRDPNYAGVPAFYIDGNGDPCFMHRESDAGPTVVRKVLLGDPQ